MYLEYTDQQIYFSVLKKHIKIYIKIEKKYLYYMFRSSTIIRELALNLVNLYLC